MLETIRLFFSTYFNLLNDWFFLKSMELNGWIMNTMFSNKWILCKQFVTIFVGVTSKFWAKYLNKTEVHNVENLLNLINKRPKGKPMITVSNHDSCCDDPLVFGASMPLSYFFKSQKNFRWSLGAKEICFTKPLHSFIFRMGQVLPIIRGNGIYQPIMNQILNELNKGCWLHIFPEGKVNMDKVRLRLKWGVGRLITDAVNTPVVLPFCHYGMDTILANYPPYVPQINKKTTIVYGEPIYFDDMVKQLKEEKKTAEEIRKAVTDHIEEAFYQLKHQTELIHATHLAK